MWKIVDEKKASVYLCGVISTIEVKRLGGRLLLLFPI